MPCLGPAVSYWILWPSKRTDCACAMAKERVNTATFTAQSYKNAPCSIPFCRHFNRALKETHARSGQRPTFWDYLCGRVRQISVRVEKLPVPVDLMSGNYQEDPAFQKRFQTWMTALWERKDKLIDELHARMSA